MKFWLGVYPMPVVTLYAILLEKQSWEGILGIPKTSWIHPVHHNSSLSLTPTCGNLLHFVLLQMISHQCVLIINLLIDYILNSVICLELYKMEEQPIFHPHFSSFCPYFHFHYVMLFTWISASLYSKYPVLMVQQGKGILQGNPPAGKKQAQIRTRNICRYFQKGTKNNQNPTPDWYK